MSSKDLSASEINAQLSAMEAIFHRLAPSIKAAAGKTAHRDKDDNGHVTPTTNVDVETEQTIVRHMAQLFPETPVYGEESGYDENAIRGTFWLLDPIDGTKSFVSGTEGYTMMAALIQNGKIVASVICDPHNGDTYSARAGEGAFKNGQRLDLTKVPLPTLAYGRERLIGFINGFLQDSGVRCEDGPTGAGYAFGRVASGTIAARFNFPHKPTRAGSYPHDYASGALLVQEAGGIVISLEEDSEYNYHTRSFVACHPALAELVRQNAQQLRAEEIRTA